VPGYVCDVRPGSRRFGGLGRMTTTCYPPSCRDGCSGWARAWPGPRPQPVLGRETDPRRAYAESKACDVALALAWNRKIAGRHLGGRRRGVGQDQTGQPGAPGDVSSSADTIAFCCTAPDVASPPSWKNRAPTPAPDRYGTPPSKMRSSRRAIQW
jgi:hypothetical protein